MQVDQEDLKNQAGDKEEKKSVTEEMEVHDIIDRLITKLEMLIEMVCDPECSETLQFLKSLSSKTWSWPASSWHSEGELINSETGLVK